MKPPEKLEWRASDIQMKKKEKNRKWPHIGMRIIKSSVAVILCFCIYALRGGEGAPFYSALSALWCMQTYSSNSIQNAAQRIVGTLIGAAYGLAVLLFEINVLNLTADQSIWCYLISGLMIIPIIYSTVLFNKKNASYFSCVVFLSITIAHFSDTNPFLFVANRVVDTVIGVIVSLFVNTVHIPRKKRRNTLFVSELDNTLLTDEKMTSYSAIELNRMIDDGAIFTIYTMKTPASAIDMLKGLRLKLPIIAMNGAVMYDMNENTYVKIHSLPEEKLDSVLEFLNKRKDVCVFTNIIRDDRHTIYYQDFTSSVQEEIFRTLKKSPYRTYIHRQFCPDTELAQDNKAVYLMMIDADEKMREVYMALCESGFDDMCKILIYPSSDFPGNTYIKIYDKTVSRHEMINCLKDMSGADDVVRFGSEAGHNTIVVSGNDGNTTSKLLKRTYEPYFWESTDRPPRDSRADISQ